MAIVTTSIDPEAAARQLRREMWDRQCTLWPGEMVTPMDFCDPWVAAQFLEFQVQEGYVSSPGTKAGFQLGGFINRPAKVIGISDQQSERTKRFTLAHEVGHLVMHPGLHEHREMPIHGLTEPRDPVDLKERQANQFAGHFLVPKKLLARAFQTAFGVDNLTLTDDVAWELHRADFKSLMSSPNHSLAFERVVATALRFRGHQFGALTDLFQVSPMTLAIRLRETGLVRR